MKQKIIDIVCGEYGIEFDEILQKKRVHEHVEVRQAICYFLRCYIPTMSWREIGEVFYMSKKTAYYSFYEYEKNVINVRYTTVLHDKIVSKIGENKSLTTTI
jgi:chromosomal replication initiation ATPase DnaA